MQKLNNCNFLIFSSVLLLLVFFRVHYLYSNPYWLDEAYTYWFVNRSFTDLFFWVPTFESHPPFYYSVVKIWNIFFGFIEYSERYFSLFVSLAVFPIIYKTSELLNYERKNELTILFGLLIFLNPQINWYSIEARPYALLLLCYSFAIYGFLRVILSSKKDNIGWLFITIGTLLTNWCHSLGSLFSSVIYACLFLHFIFYPSKVFLGRLIISTLIVFALSIPLLLMILAQMKSWGDSSWIDEITLKSTFKGLASLYSIKMPFESTLLSKTFFNEIIGKVIFYLPVLTVPFIFLYGIYQSWHSKLDNKLTFFYLMLLAIVVPILTILVTYLGPNVFLIRTLIPVLFPYYALVAMTLVSITNVRLKWLLIGFVLLQVLSSTVYSLETKKKEPWKEIFSKVVSVYAPNDQILILPNSLIHPLNHVSEGAFERLNFKSLPFEYPAIGKSDFYPVGTLGVAGFREEDVGSLHNLLKDNNGKIIFIYKQDYIFDPQKLIKQELERTAVNIEKYDFGTIPKYNIEIYE